MSAKSICQALFVLVAVTLVSGQYLLTTIYDDSSCTTENGGFSVQNLGPSCSPDTSCTDLGGIYKKDSCVSVDPLATLPPNAAIAWSYFSSNVTCTQYSAASAVPLDRCSASSYSVIKFSGCNADNSSFIYYSYDTFADCQSNTPSFVSVYVDNECRPSMGDQKFSCPVGTPVAPPMDAPVAAPMAAPVAAPVAATPTAAPVAAAPKAATPAKKSSTATNVMIGAGLAMTMLLVLA